MGYFNRPIRRSVAREAWCELIEGTRGVSSGDWQRCGPSITPPADSFLRFVVERPRTGTVGLFRSCDLIGPSAELPAAVRSQVRTAFRWFNSNVPVPQRLPRNAACWFKADAGASLNRLRTLIEAYRMAGHTVYMQATLSPGRVVYRDRYQVAAIPYRDHRMTSNAL